MAKTRKVPVLKNHGIVVKKSQKRASLRKFGLIVLVFTLMLVYVWLKVQTNLILAEIQVLDAELNQSLAENGKLQAEVVRLSSFGRIQKIAKKKLGLDFIPRENIIEISKK